MPSDPCPRVNKDIRISGKMLKAYARDAGLCCHLLHQQSYVAPVRLFKSSDLEYFLILTVLEIQLAREHNVWNRLKQSPAPCSPGNSSPSKSTRGQQFLHTKSHAAEGWHFSTGPSLRCTGCRGRSNTTSATSCRGPGHSSRCTPRISGSRWVRGCVRGCAYFKFGNP